MLLNRRQFALASLAQASPLIFLSNVSRPVWAQAKQAAVTLSVSLEPDSLDPTTAASASIGEVVHYNLFEGLT